jgi:hypothetical protein
MMWQNAAQAPGSTSSGLFDGGFSWGLVLLAVVGLIALVIVCSLGFLARMRDRAVERQEREATQRAQHPPTPAG